MRRKLIAGNWKMNGSVSANASLLAEISAGGVDVAKADVLVCPPFPYLTQALDKVQGTAIAVGAQDCSVHDAGAYTSEVSAAMLRDVGCTYVILGHSERRSYHAESDQIVAAKTLQALRAGLTPIVCVGETLEQRESGATDAVVGAQLKAVLEKLDSAEIAKIVVAYEPVWAIGTGKTATPEMAQEVHAFLRQVIASFNAEAAATVKILYGGSMKPDNAAELLRQTDIDGGLIGGAALKANDFLAIIAAV